MYCFSSNVNLSFTCMRPNVCIYHLGIIICTHINKGVGFHDTLGVNFQGKTKWGVNKATVCSESKTEQGDV